MDANGNGTLSKEEMMDAYRAFHGDAFNVDEVERMMEMADADGNGEIQYSEWMVATANRKSLMGSEKMQAAFKAFDKDGSGTVSAEELKEMLGVAKGLDQEAWQKAIDKVDSKSN